jgi:hypothetical protein
VANKNSVAIATLANEIFTVLGTVFENEIPESERLFPVLPILKKKIKINADRP